MLRSFCFVVTKLQKEYTRSTLRKIQKATRNLKTISRRYTFNANKLQSCRLKNFTLCTTRPRMNQIFRKCITTQTQESNRGAFFLCMQHKWDSTTCSTDNGRKKPNLHMQILKKIHCFYASLWKWPVGTTPTPGESWLLSLEGSIFWALDDQEERQMNHGVSKHSS